ncbi:hypothetical protein TNIN_366031 [Trichonephila inaurata madagascariensis]|uniref:Uncharacterized protein n=1 Tax=Trichonephila inaurata madagascariensis TaxID=2747483 RepID=A0A8X6IYJ4_9ARAC|nr:hypothetical protein TNIN_366031 [Trichonephila inaurata madagascariensis]
MKRLYSRKDTALVLADRKKIFIFEAALREERMLLKNRRLHYGIAKELSKEKAVKLSCELAWKKRKRAVEGQEAALVMRENAVKACETAAGR